MASQKYAVSYPINEKYATKVAYFSMEFAIHQPLKIYSGGLGFLSGSHLRSAYELNQNLIGVGILWKYGYYDQGRNEDQTLRVDWTEKNYAFLEDTGIKFTIKIHGADVWVKAFYLNPEVFDTAPLFLLTTDIPENDYISQTISHRLYDDNEATKLAQYILLGVGGAKLLELIGFDPDIHHMNEAHALPLAFSLLKKYQSKEALKAHLVFTTHTPEEAGNEKHSMQLCFEMGYFDGLSMDEVVRLTGMTDGVLNLSLAALRFSKKANGVSQLHGEVSRHMWQGYSNICEIISITNAQDWKYWSDKHLYAYKQDGNVSAFDDRKRYLKKRTFEIIADQTGKIFDPEILTIVWARRFASYKRADLITRDWEHFQRILSNTSFPIQFIWAGKPYPLDTDSIKVFNSLVEKSKHIPNMAVITGYELGISKRLKQGADIWLNNPRVPREASGTSGMSAAMNGAINFSTVDGWIPEFAKDGENCFLIPQVDYVHLSTAAQDQADLDHLYAILENKIIPLYYQDKENWRNIIYQSMDDVRNAFDTNRMADEYYTQLYNG